MEFRWAKSFAKGILMVLVMSIVFNALYGVYVYVQAVQTLDTRMGDLSMMVSDENCLSKDGASNSPYNLFLNLLAASESSTLRFADVDGGRLGGVSSYGPSANLDRTWAVKVLSETTPARELYSYTSVVQRGRPIRISLRARVNVPMFLMGGMPLPLPIYVQREYIVTGTRFYKAVV